MEVIERNFRISQMYKLMHTKVGDCAEQAAVEGMKGSNLFMGGCVPHDFQGIQDVLRGFSSISLWAKIAVIWSCGCYRKFM